MCESAEMIGTSVTVTALPPSRRPASDVGAMLRPEPALRLVVPAVRLVVLGPEGRTAPIGLGHHILRGCTATSQDRAPPWGRVRHRPRPARADRRRRGEHPLPALVG